MLRYLHMSRYFISIFMAITLLLTNVVGSHCHSSDCSEDNAYVASLDDDGDNTTGLAKLDTHCSHNHGAAFMLTHAASFSTVVTTTAFEWRSDDVVSDNRKPLLQPPSLS